MRRRCNRLRARLSTSTASLAEELEAPLLQHRALPRLPGDSTAGEKPSALPSRRGVRSGVVSADEPEVIRWLRGGLMTRGGDTLPPPASADGGAVLDGGAEAGLLEAIVLPAGGAGQLVHGE